MNRKERKDQERSDASGSKENETPVFLTGDSTLQTPEEDRKDKSGSSASPDTMEVSNDDLHGINSDGESGSDGAENQ